MKRIWLIIEVASVLLLCACGAAVGHLWKSHAVTLQMAGTAMIVPSIATLLFTCISVSVPELYSVGSLRAPITITLPLVYSAMLVLTMSLISRVGPTISRLPEELAPITLWSDLWVVGINLLAGVACLSALGRLERERLER